MGTVYFWDRGPSLILEGTCKQFVCLMLCPMLSSCSEWDIGCAVKIYHENVYYISHITSCDVHEGLFLILNHVTIAAIVISVTHRHPRLSWKFKSSGLVLVMSMVWSRDIIFLFLTTTTTRIGRSTSSRNKTRSEKIITLPKTSV